MTDLNSGSGETPVLKTGRLVIDKNTLVPLGSLITAFALFFGAYAFINDRFSALDRRLERIEDNLADQWTRGDMILWATELSRDNPTLTVPPPVGKIENGR